MPSSPMARTLSQYWSMQAIARRASELDVLVNRMLSMTRELHSVAVDHLAEAFELGLRPHVADRHVVERADDAA